MLLALSYSAEHPVERISSIERTDVDAEWQVLVKYAHPNAGNRWLSDALHNHALNWAALLDLAADHAIFPIVASRLLRLEGEAVPSEIRGRLRGQIRAHTLFCLRATGELFRIVENLANSGIAAL